MTYGNYDAGQSRPVSNPYFDGGVRSNGIIKTGFDFGFKTDKTGSSRPAWGIERTSSVTPEERVAASTERTFASITATMAETADNDRAIDEMLSPYITNETRNRMASTSFNAAMSLGDFEEAYRNLA